MKDGDVDPRREGNFGGPLRRERGRNRHACANKVHERGRALARVGYRSCPHDAGPRAHLSSVTIEQ